jgi:hypothetical protein
VVLKIPEYTFEQFSQIAKLRLTGEYVREEFTLSIAQKVWYELGSKDIRDVIKLARLCRDESDAHLVINSTKKLL